MSAAVQHRPQLEPLAPALIGVALLHVLAGLLIWTFLPLLVPEKAGRAVDETPLVWRSPADFLLEAAPMPVAPAPPPVVVAAIAPVPPPTPPPAPKPAAPATSAKPKTLTFIPAHGSKDKKPAAAAVSSATTVSPQTLNDISNSITSMVAGPRTLPTAGLTINSLEQDPLMRAASPLEGTGQKMESNAAAPPPSAAPPQPVAAVSAEESEPPAATEGQGREANKYITLSDILPERAAISTPRPGKPVLNLLDIAALNENKRAQETEAGGADMEPVKKALERAILREWKAPPIQSVPAAQRRVTVELAVMRDGTVRDAVMKTHSGSEALDASVRAAAGRVTKIPETLPSSFPKERYDLRVNFQIE